MCCRPRELLLDFVMYCHRNKTCFSPCRVGIFPLIWLYRLLFDRYSIMLIAHLTPDFYWPCCLHQHFRDYSRWARAEQIVEKIWSFSGGLRWFAQFLSIFLFQIQCCISIKSHLYISIYHQHTAKTRDWQMIAIHVSLYLTKHSPQDSSNYIFKVSLRKNSSKLRVLICIKNQTIRTCLNICFSIFCTSIFIIEFLTFIYNKYSNL